MKKILFFICTVVCLLAATSAMAIAAEVVVGGSISRGQENSMAYQLGVKQVYDPFIANDVCDLTPSIGLSGHAWVPSNGDVSWGATIPFGLRLGLVTTSNFKPYLAGALGPTVISERVIDKRDLGSNVLIMSQGAIGVSFGETLQHNIEGQYTHHSTWGITNRDPGYDTYGVSYGYAF